MAQLSIYEVTERCYTPDQLIEIYNECDSALEASERLGIAPKRLAVIASRLRSRGRVVKKFGGQW